ncbi:MAG: hypothetical protein Q9P01_02700 [Anaerolineae bacterium]|nr:hypothetical protein [Anaerolineae bacterium]
MPIEPLPSANIFFPNYFAHYFLQSLEAVMGKNGIAGALKAANLAHLINHYPLDNHERGFDTDDFSMLNAGLETLIGRRLGRGFARRAGRHMLENHFAAITNTQPIILTALQAVPLNIRLKLIMPRITQHIVGQQSASTTTIDDDGRYFVVNVEKCPVCWGRKANNSRGTGAYEPICAAIVGMYEGALYYISKGKKYRVLETACLAQGATHCRFQIEKKPFA